MELSTWYGFKPPRVKRESEGVAAFRAYDRYYQAVVRWMSDRDSVYLVPCAGTKPIYKSPLHRSIYQKYIAANPKREPLVVSEPCVLIRYKDLYGLEPVFCYDFPPKLLVGESRRLFVSRLRRALAGKNVRGCLPSHHARLINDAIGTGWKNDWSGDLYEMAARANKLPR